MRSKLSGWAEITHPFHPLRGQRFKILKVRRCSGIETLILKEASRGSFAIPIDWTDRSAATVETEDSILDFGCLSELADLVRHCLKPNKKVFDK